MIYIGKLLFDCLKKGMCCTKPIKFVKYFHCQEYKVITAVCNMHFQSPSVNSVEPLPSLEDLDNTVFGVTDRKRRLSVIGKLYISIVLIVKTFLI